MLRDIALMERAELAFYVQYTINGYPRELDPHAPAACEAAETLRALSAEIGPERVIWRYDPIILSTRTPPTYHAERFSQLARELRGHVRVSYVSFCDPYAKTRRGFARLSARAGWEFRFGDPEERAVLARELAEIAASCGMQLSTCAEVELEVPGVERGSCVNAELLARQRPDLRFRARPAPTRHGCGCVESIDIGAYDTCSYGCVYCYANRNEELARRHQAEHDSSDSLLWRSPALWDRAPDLLCAAP
jgi:hypothetical protein